jgi:hypothetical protein
MKAAWLKAKTMIGKIDLAALSNKAWSAWKEGAFKWGDKEDMNLTRAASQHEKARGPFSQRGTTEEEFQRWAKRADARWRGAQSADQENRNQDAKWEYEQSYRSDPTPRGFTMRDDERDGDRTYQTGYTHTSSGTKAKRVMPDQHVIIACSECGTVIGATHYPGNTGHYCSPACKHRATNRQAAARMRAKRLRDK